MSSSDKTNVLLEKLTECVADRTVACEQRLDSIEEIVKCLLKQNVEQTKNNDEIAGTIKTLNKYNEPLVIYQKKTALINYKRGRDN